MAGLSHVHVLRWGAQMVECLREFGECQSGNGDTYGLDWRLGSHVAPRVLSMRMDGLLPLASERG